MQHILVLCTGNSCRSIMAEALINHLGHQHYRAYSAGSHPTGYVHPRSLATLRRHGIDPGTPTSQSWEVFANKQFDQVITVCNQAASETCPAFLGDHHKRHWDIPDPAKVEGSDEQIDQAFENVFQMLKQRINQDLL